MEDDTSVAGYGDQIVLVEKTIYMLILAWKDI